MKKKEVWYAVIGGVVGAVLTMLAGSVVPIGAQPKASDLNVGEITCTGITVLDGGSIAVIDENVQSMASIGADRRGGFVAVRDKQGKAGVTIRIEEFGGMFTVHGNKDENSVAALMIDDHNGGSVLVVDKYGESRWLTSGGVSPLMDSR